MCMYVSMYACIYVRMYVLCKQGDALSPLIFNFALDMPLGGFR